MNTPLRETTGATAPPPATAPSGAPTGGRGARERMLAARVRPHHLALAAVLAGSAVLNTYRLSQNGYANIFYSAGVKSMLRSLHNFVFVSFDPGGLVSVDKPPLALWLQAASAKVFGFGPLSLLLPEALAGVLAVALLYRVVSRRLGVAAGLAAALALAVFPSFVAVSRENGVDALLILLMVMACGAGLRAIETGRWRTLIWSGVLVGLAFNTKTLAAALVVPGLAAGYLVCAPGSLPRRCAQLLAAGLAMVVVACAWLAFVDLTPASERPYVGSSTDNSEFGLTFAYNGFGRVGGQEGGPGHIVVRPGARVPSTRSHRRTPVATGRAAPGARGRGRGGHARTHPAGTVTPPAAGAATASGVAGAPVKPGTATHSEGREKNPIPFGGPPGPLRLFGRGLGDQGGWLVPLALVGLLALIASLLPARRDRGVAPDGAHLDPASSARTPLARTDGRLATALVLGGWFIVEAVVLSTSKGIVHPYYTSALAPGTGAMAGAGVAALGSLTRGRHRPAGLALATAAVAATVAVEVVLLHREHYMLWFVPVLAIAAVIGLGALAAARRLATPAIGALFCLLLVAPAAYAATTWLAPVQGTFPAAGPKQAAGAGGYGVGGRDLQIRLALARFARAHDPRARWPILTVAATTAAPLILNGLDAAAVGGYSGTDPALDGASLARAVASGRARYVLLGGEFSSRGGNGATRAVLRACRQMEPSEWHSPVAYPFGLTLFDCAGREAALAR